MSLISPFVISSVNGDGFGMISYDLVVLPSVCGGGALPCQLPKFTQKTALQ
jgi:hypothetical protein